MNISIIKGDAQYNSNPVTPNTSGDFVALMVGVAHVFC
jgi:hypothetical protein